jgi:thiamine-phosphate pyrophosphorylase
LLATVEAAIDGGVTLVQYRSTHPLKGAAYAEALALRQLLSSRSIPLIINNHADLALALDADGLHIGQHDLPPPVARRLLGKNKLLGLSINNHTQLAKTDFSLLDYIGIGPIFATQTKPDASPVVGLEHLAALVRQSPLPVVAIGGISSENATATRATGVAGLAVVSAICSAPNPAAAAALLRNR